MTVTDGLYLNGRRSAVRSGSARWSNIDSVVNTVKLHDNLSNKVVYK